MYIIVIVLLFAILPMISIAVEKAVATSPGDAVHLIGKWFTFWGVGVRLFSAGVRQTWQPAFTAREIFGIDDPVVLPFVRELGFANISMGLIAVVSIVAPAWRTPAALAGAIYYGLAGIRHLLEAGEMNDLRFVAMSSDLFIFAILAAYLMSSAVARKPI